LPVLNQISPCVDISALVHPGENRLAVRTASTLGNRMIADGRIRENAQILKEEHTKQLDYGLLDVVFYTKA